MVQAGKLITNLAFLSRAGFEAFWVLCLGFSKV